MTLFRKLTGLLQSPPPPRAAPTLPVASLTKAAPYTPTAAPVIELHLFDAEVMRLYRVHNHDPVAVATTLISISRDLDQELADLRAELARLTALPRFKP